MKLLFDQNLSRHLVNLLDDIFPNSSHVSLVNLEKESDNIIWEYAKKNAYCIVSQDADFAERCHLYGSPPKVIWLRCGNSTTKNIAKILRNGFDSISEFGDSNKIHYIELF